MTATTLLVVDDEPALLGLMKRYLERSGYSVIACDRGEEAWAAFEGGGGACDAVVVDLSLPDLSGEDLLSRMFRKRPGLRAVVCSGSPAPGAPMEECRHIVYLQKPFLPRSLVEAVERVLAAD